MKTMSDFRGAYHLSESWAVIIYRSVSISKGLILTRGHSTYSFSCARGNRTPHEVSKHATFRETSAFRTRHKACEQNPFLTQYCLDALALRRQESVKVGDRMVWAFMISRSDEAGQDVIIGSVQRIVVTQSYDILTTLTQEKHLNSPTV